MINIERINIMLTADPLHVDCRSPAESTQKLSSQFDHPFDPVSNVKFLKTEILFEKPHLSSSPVIIQAEINIRSMKHRASCQHMLPFLGLELVLFISIIY